MSLLHRLVWREIHWQRPVDPDDALDLVRRLAADPLSHVVVLEARHQGGGVRYFCATAPAFLLNLERQLSTLVPGTRLVPFDDQHPRRQLAAARHLKASTRHRPLRADPAGSTRHLLGALSATGDDEVLVLQLVLGPRRIPLAVPTQSPSSVVAPWWTALTRGNGGVIDGEKRSALRGKVSDHGFACAVRIGVQATSPGRRADLARGLLGAIRTTEAAGVRLRMTAMAASDLDSGRRPRWLWPLRLNASEVLTLTGWPLGDDDLPGLAGLHPRRLPPASGAFAKTPTQSRQVVARSLTPGMDGFLTQSIEDTRRHTHVMSPTGAGKSVLLGRLIEQQIAAGRSVVVIEPRGDLVEDVLAHIPAERIDDVVVLDPASDTPVGLNPLVAPGRSPVVIADGLLSVFRAMYADAWGPRLQDLLHASLLTLARRRGSSLVMLPLLLTNSAVRRQLTAELRDPIALGPFWAWYENLSDGERAAAIAPLMNKLRPWLFSPQLRAVLGQPEPRFDLRDLLTERRILLVPLRGGVIGPEVARLLGSVVVAQLWQLIQSRTAVPPERRHPVMIYIDEVQDYLHLPTDLGDALAQARGLGAALTLSHQHIGQLPPDIRAGVLANARSRLLFQLGHDDAAVMAKGHPEIEPQDFTSLGPFELYASLVTGGQVTPYAVGRSLPPGPPISDPAVVRARSQARYGRPMAEVDHAVEAMLRTHDAAGNSATGTSSGRRRRSADD